MSAETLTPRVGRLVDAWNALHDAIGALDESDLPAANWKELEGVLMTAALEVRYRPRAGEREGVTA